jgi:hypothetical protein
VARVHEQSIPTEQLQLFGEVSANFCCLDRSHYFFFQVALISNISLSTTGFVLLMAMIKGKFDFLFELLCNFSYNTLHGFHWQTSLKLSEQRTPSDCLFGCIDKDSAHLLD